MFNQNNITNGGNPQGNFNSHTSNNPINRNFYNYQNSYTPNNNIIERPNFRNEGNLVHNNVKDKVLHEFLNDYTIYIESRDRSIDAYPNPCKFTVIFGGDGPQQIKKKVITKQKNGEAQTERYDKILFAGSPAPIVARKFKNIKVAKLDFVILPKTFAVQQDASGNYTLSSNPTYMIDRYKYLILKITELNSNRTLATNNVIGNDGILIYQDKYLGGSENTLWRPANGIRIFPDSRLVNINKLTISILDPFGNQLIVFNEDTGKEINMKDIYEDQNESVRDVLSEKSLYDYLQLTMSLVFGVIENEIDTDTKFEQ